jgi:hypothetical protein
MISPGRSNDGLIRIPAFALLATPTRRLAFLTMGASRLGGGVACAPKTFSHPSAHENPYRTASARRAVAAQGMAAN